MTEPFAPDGSPPYDVDYPDTFREFMRHGWLDTPEPVTPHRAREVTKQSGGIDELAG